MHAGTPLIAEQRLLDTHPYIKEEHVFLRQPGEDEVAAMYRIVQLPDDVIMAKRAAVARLREHLITRSTEKFRKLFEDAQDIAAEELGLRKHVA